MEKVIREVAQFQLIHDVGGDNYLIRNSITEKNPTGLKRKRSRPYWSWIGMRLPQDASREQVIIF